MVRILIAILCVSCAVTFAEEDDHDHDMVAAAGEHDTDAAQAFDGPRETAGVQVAAVGAVALTEVAELSDRQVRVREITIQPGGRVAVHEHKDRPGLAYILSGEAVEHRAGVDGERVFGPGRVAFEQDGVVHWWENRTDEPVRALVVDIVPQ